MAECDPTGRLTAGQLRRVKRGAKLQRFRDGAGLYLEVTEAPPADYPASRSGMYWMCEYTVRGRPYVASIGDYPDISLESARKLRDLIHAEARRGRRHPHEWVEVKWSLLRPSYWTDLAATMRRYADAYEARAAEAPTA